MERWGRQGHEKLQTTVTGMPTAPLNDSKSCTTLAVQYRSHRASTQKHHRLSSCVAPSIIILRHSSLRRRCARPKRCKEADGARNGPCRCGNKRIRLVVLPTSYVLVRCFVCGTTRTSRACKCWALGDVCHLE